MKKLSAVLLSIILVLSTSIGALAQSLTISSVEKEGNLWVVKGTWPGEKPLTIEVLKKSIIQNDEEVDLKWEDVKDADDINILNYLVYFNQIDELNENDGFEFKIAGIENEPEVRVYSDGEYFYHSRETLNKINNALKENTTYPEDQFDNVIMGYDFLERKINEITQVLNEEEKEEFWNKLYAYKEEESEFSNFGELVTASEEIAILSQIALSQSQDELKENLDLLLSFGINSSNSYDLYMKKGVFGNETYLTQDQKEILFNSLTDKSRELNIVADFIEYFNEKVVLTSCHNNSSDYLVKDIIGKSDVLASAGIGKYSKIKLGQKLKIAEAINKNEYESIFDLSQKVITTSNKFANENGGDTSGKDVVGDKSDSSNKENFGVSTKPATPPVSEESKNTFTDIASHAWAQDAIYSLKEKGIISGTSATTFEPERGVTREEFVKMLVIACGVLDTSAKAPFADSVDGAWYVPYIASAYNAKLVNGITDTTFGVGTSITREQLAVLVYRVLSHKGKLQDKANDISFTDTNLVSDYAKEAVSYVTSSGIMNGMGDGTFAPSIVVTRAQAAKVIYELLGRI